MQRTGASEQTPGHYLIGGFYRDPRSRSCHISISAPRESFITGAFVEKTFQRRLADEQDSARSYVYLAMRKLATTIARCSFDSHCRRCDISCRIPVVLQLL
jgi:hypothetical protein